MEKDENYVVAIDMGTTKVATLVGRKAEDGKVEVVAASCCPASGIARGERHEQAKDALKSAAYTYVVAALGSLATLVYYIMIFAGRRE